MLWFFRKSAEKKAALASAKKEAALRKKEDDEFYERESEKRINNYLKRIVDDRREFKKEVRDLLKEVRDTFTKIWTKNKETKEETKKHSLISVEAAIHWRSFDNEWRYLCEKWLNERQKYADFWSCFSEEELYRNRNNPRYKLASLMSTEYVRDLKTATVDCSSIAILLLDIRKIEYFYQNEPTLRHLLQHPIQRKIQRLAFTEDCNNAFIPLIYRKELTLKNHLLHHPLHQNIRRLALSEGCENIFIPLMRTLFLAFLEQMLFNYDNNGPTIPRFFQDEKENSFLPDANDIEELEKDFSKLKIQPREQEIINSMMAPNEDKTTSCFSAVLRGLGSVFAFFKNKQL